MVYFCFGAGNGGRTRESRLGSVHFAAKLYLHHYYFITIITFWQLFLKISKFLTIVAVLSYNSIGEIMTKFINKESCFIGENVKIGNNVTIYENNHIEGDTTIGDNTTLLPGNFISSCKIGKSCKVLSSVLEDSEILDDVSIGPFARLRPHTLIKNGCKIGNFVEIKNSSIGNGCKISHLAYVGDVDMGADCNIGCGVIFANYNGKQKNRTIVGRHVFIGSNSNIIAPVSIEDDSYICAGTTVTEKDEKHDMVIGRTRQQNKPGRAKKYWEA